MLKSGEESLSVGLRQVVNDKGEFWDVVDSVSSGHYERDASRGSKGRGNCMSSLSDVDLSVPPSPDLERSEHSGFSAHVSESSLARA